MESSYNLRQNHVWQMEMTPFSNRKCITSWYFCLNYELVGSWNQVAQKETFEKQILAALKLPPD